MAKISELPRLNVPSGRETVVVLADGQTRAVEFGPLASAMIDPKLNAAIARVDDARGEALSAVGAAQALANLRATRAEGAAEFPVGRFFASNETGTVRIYKVIAQAPGYEDQGDASAPVDRSSMQREFQHRIDWVTPEQFGAIGDGNPANAGRDTAAVQAAVDTGLPVILRSGGTYTINAEIIPPVGKDLVIQGRRNTGNAGARMTAVDGFVGWMLRPRANYDVRDVRLIGNNRDGCYLIGSPDNSTAGLARIERVYLSDCDVGIYFADAWEHPWGLYYNQIVGVNFRTGGINLGGKSAAASSGESAWSMDNINMIGSSGAGTAAGLSGGIAAPGLNVAASSPDAISDTITWDNSVPPLYGWCVMRSANGSSGWHIPPNWRSEGLDADTFVARKAAGEAWTYRVVRMTRGMHVRRGKAINIGVAQLEYFGIGVYAEDVFALAIGQHYSETRDRPVPLPAYAGVVAKNASVAIAGGWCEQFGYAVVSSINSRVTVSGPLRANNCKWGRAAIGGATGQSLRLTADLRAGGTTPNAIVPLHGSIFDYAVSGTEFDAATSTMTTFVDGADHNAFSVRRRGIEKGRFGLNASGEAELRADRIRQVQSSTALTPPLSNAGFRTNLMPGAATQIMTIAGLPANNAASLTFHYVIEIRDGDSVQRQTIAGRIDVALLDTANLALTAAVAASAPAKAVQQGAIAADPAFTASVAAGVVTISCTVMTTQPNARIYLVPVAGAAAAGALTITHL